MIGKLKPEDAIKVYITRNSQTLKDKELTRLVGKSSIGKEL